MNNSYLSIFLFGAGVIAQSFFMIRKNIFKRNTWIKFAFIFLLSLFSFLPGRHEHGYALHSHIIIYFFMYILLYVSLFSREILPDIDERSLLTINIFFGYLLIWYFRSEPISTFWLCFFSIPALIMSLAVLINALIPKPPPYFLKIIFYVWFMAMSAFVVFAQFPVSPFLKLIQSGDLDLEKGLYLFTAGMTFVCISMNVINIYLLVPIPGKGQSLKDRVKDLKEHLQMLNGKYLDTQLVPWKTILAVAACIAIIVIGQLVLNWVAVLTANLGLLGNYFISSRLRAKSIVPVL